ncbi:TPA: phage tail tip protein J-related protein [Proteus mirabilis]
MGKTVTSVVSAGLMIAGVIATGGLGTALIVAGIAVQAASAFIFKDKVPGSGYRDQSERKQMLRSASAPETVVVGKTMMSGLLFFAEEEEGEQDENEELYMALAIASHPIHKLGQIYFNDDKIEDLGDNAQYEFHNGRTEADPYLLKHAPSWKEDMIGRGLAWLRLTLRFDQEKFPYGVPNVKSELWGKEIYDPRTEKTAWSNNGALVILDYYRHYLGVPDSDIDWNAFKVAADICDETVQTPDGKSEPRYTLNGAYELEESPASVLEMMHKCIAGEPTYIAGKHGILMQVYNGPALLIIDESQIIDTVTVTPELSLRDATNAIYGTFVDAEQQYNKTDFEPVVIEEWIEEDGLEIKENMDYRFVTSPYQANRLANLYLRKKRAGRRIQLRMNLDGYAYRPGDVVKLELPSLGISDLEFRIADWKFHPSEGVEITLEEDGPYIYEDLASKPFVRPPFTKLPTGGVPAPINLAFVPLSVTDIVQGYISWQNVASDIRYNTVNILQNDKVIQSIQVPGERVDINGLTRGTYRVEVRAINVAGAMSAPAISDFAIQAPPAPIGVEITSGMFSLTAYPKQGDSAVFGYTFEFWFSEKKLANLSENEVITKTNKVGQGNFWTQENLKAGHTYYFYIRTINSYGKSVFVEASGVPVSLPTDIFDDLDNTVRETEAFKQLSEELKWNTESIAVLTNATYSLSTDVLQRSANAQAGITQLQQLRVSDNEARAQEIKEIYSAVGENKSAIKETQTSITKLDEAFGQRFTAIRTDMDKAQADIMSNSQAISNTNKAFAENKTQVQAKFDEQEGMIQEKMQATFKQTGDGVVTHSINITIVHNNVKYNAAGQVISAQVKNGKLESYIGYNANNFAWYNPVNGKMELFMYVKNGQMFMREAFINEAWLNSVVVTEYIKSGDYAPGKSGFLIDGKTSNIEMNKGIFRGELDIGTNKTGAHTVITNERIAVYGDKGEIRVEIGRILGR